MKTKQASQFISCSVKVPYSIFLDNFSSKEAAVKKKPRLLSGNNLGAR